MLKLIFQVPQPRVQIRKYESQVYFKATTFSWDEYFS